jgi:hypothetical protein
MALMRTIVIPLGIISLIWMLMATVFCASAAENTISYPRPEGRVENVDAYAIELLSLALRKAGAHHTVRLTDEHMKQARALMEIEQGHGKVDIMVTMTSPERERQLLPIRIPVSKGLVGWRIALLRADRSELFRNIRTLGDMTAMRAGQGHDWPDTDILRSNGLPVQAVSGYDGLFSLLEAGRIDYFPRSMREIWPELASHTNLVPDRYIILHYRTTDYFFINRRNVQLANEVRSGLEVAIADGSFDRLFYEHFAEPIRRAQLNQRRVIELNSPAMSSETPPANSKLWFSIADLQHVPGIGSR